jgi:hypothetical protein
MKGLALWVSLAAFMVAVPLKAEFHQIDLTTFGMD